MNGAGSNEAAVQAAVKPTNRFSRRAVFSAMHEPLKFVAVGLANTAVGLSIIYLLKWFGSGDVAANAAGYALGLMVSFVLNRRWTFAHSGAAVPAALRFLLVFAVSYLANLFTVLWLIDVLHVNGYVAQVMGVPPYTILFYFGSRHFAFPRAGEHSAGYSR